ncbi:MAG: hypothetical protein Q9170_000775 [Blastenia crenularia]
MAYNVDYNDLKRLIKVRTTRGQGEAVTIPGHANEARSLQAFENDFFAELVDQHQRVDLFVRSKAGEINRRLVHLDKQVQRLQQRFPLYHTQKISVRCLERFAKAEEAAEKAGEEIRSLAQYVGVQKLAFIKLLKKYKKWTASLGLESRFRTKVLNQPAAFSKRDFQPLLNQYIDVLAAVRAPFDYDGDSASQQSIDNGTAPGGHKTSQRQNVQSIHTSRQPLPSTAAKIQAVCQDSSDVDFDSSLAIIPLGRAGGKASYWIHPDNLIELHVLLLQYTRLRRATNVNAADTAANESRLRSCRASTSGDGNCSRSGGDEGVGLVICDNLQEFARRRSGAPISDTDEPAGRVLEKAAVTVRYSSSGEALVAVNISTIERDKECEASGPFRKLRTKRKSVRQLFGSRQSSSTADLLPEEQILDDEANPKSLERWLSCHQEIQPLVQLQFQRTRFVGLTNAESCGAWATLDRDIRLKKTPEGLFNTKAGDLCFDDFDACESAKFPFAVLEVRYEGGSETGLLASLDKSHLTERIRGFSMETHAVATLCKPKDLPPPYWLPALDQDLRKIPATVKTASSSHSNHQLSPSTSVRKTPTSITSVGEHTRGSDHSMRAFESSATSVPEVSASSHHSVYKKKRRPRREKPLGQQSPADMPVSNQRYWNEYDNGDENSENEPFAIYIDPDKSTSFPGFRTSRKAVASLISQLKASTTEVKSWLQSAYSSPRNIQAPTKNGSIHFRGVTTPEDGSDEDDVPTDPLLHRIHGKHRQYSTFGDGQMVHYAVGARESLLARCCLASFVSSFVLLLVAAMLVSAGRRKAIFKVDVGVITGGVFSLVFAIVGTGCMFKRQGNVGIIHRVLVFTALAAVCVASGVLLAGVVGG